MHDQEQTVAYALGQIKTTKHLSLPLINGNALYQRLSLGPLCTRHKTKWITHSGPLPWLHWKKKKQPAEDLMELDNNGSPKIL